MDIGVQPGLQKGLENIQSRQMLMLQTNSKPILMGYTCDRGTLATSNFWTPIPSKSSKPFQNDPSTYPVGYVQSKRKRDSPPS